MADCVFYTQQALANLEQLFPGQSPTILTVNDSGQRKIWVVSKTTGQLLLEHNNTLPRDFLALLSRTEDMLSMQVPNIRAGTGPVTAPSPPIAEVAALKKEVDELKRVVESRAGEVESLKRELQGWKNEAEGWKREVQGWKHENEGLRRDLAGSRRRHGGEELEGVHGRTARVDSYSSVSSGTAWSDDGSATPAASEVATDDVGLPQHPSWRA